MSWEDANACAEEEPLYTSPEDTHSGASCKSNCRKRRGKLQRQVVAVVAVSYVILLILYIRIWLRLAELESSQHGAAPDLFPCKSPRFDTFSRILICMKALAHSTAFREDRRIFPLTVAGTPFAGDPSPELDEAWHELLEGRCTSDCE